MNIFNNPKWIRKYDYPFTSINEVPDNIFEDVNLKLDRLQSKEPEITILISAWNEEMNILRTLSSLSDSDTTVPIEIIVVNNNSSDNTQQTLDKLNVTSYFQPIQGCGPSRQLGMEHAKSKYILLADADCIYPSCWINKMLEELKKDNVVCVYGRYSFISEKGYSRWKLFILETLKDFIAEVRQFKRPYLNAFGISMGYVTEYGMKVGYIMHNTRGDDGRFCFDLMKYGKVKPVRSNMARPWTSPRTLQRDGSFFRALWSRIVLEFQRFTSYFTYHEPHDTKSSKNE